ncbi:MAG: hypothetical protein ACI4JS_06275 [Oscillospiraceae bacterium]
MKTKYSDSIIEKALEKLNMSELLEHDGNVPVRATKDITLAHIDVYIPKGTLFFITRLVWNTMTKEPRYELRFAFPNTNGVDDAKGWTEYYLPCKINTNTYEIISYDGVSLTEMVESVDDSETKEMMKALYFKHCEFDENCWKYDKKNSDILDSLKIIIFFSLSGTFVLGSIAILESLLIGYIISAIWGVISIASIIAFAISNARSDYEKSSDAKMLRTVMAELCKMIAEKEQCLNNF